MWLRHWGLDRDPFAGVDSPYVPLPPHDEALARLVFAIERRERLIRFFAGGGLGKSVVLRQALSEARQPRRRIVLVHAPTNGTQLLGRLADGLGLPFAVGSDRDRVWRSIARSITASALEGVHVVLAVDGWDQDPGPATMQDLAALMDGPAVTLIRVGRGAGEEAGDRDDPWVLAIGLERLTRSEAENYLHARLARAGCRDRLFTPRAVSRLQSWSEGIPRAIDQMATFALVVAATQGMEVVTPDVVDGVALRSLVGVNAELVAR